MPWGDCQCFKACLCIHAMAKPTRCYEDKYFGLIFSMSCCYIKHKACNAHASACPCLHLSMSGATLSRGMLRQKMATCAEAVAADTRSPASAAVAAEDVCKATRKSMSNSLGRLLQKATMMPQRHV